MSQISAENWNVIRWPNFTPAEFICPHSGDCAMQAEFLDMLQQLRIKLARPLIINSGYRSATHPREIAKPIMGAHNMGCAADIAIAGRDAFELVQAAFALGCQGIGIKQHGARARRFIHLDMSCTRAHAPRPALWSYAHG